MTRHVTVMFCGPHDEAGNALLHRIDKAIMTAKFNRTPLLVCGDANRGEDVRLYVDRARAADVDAYGLYSGKLGLRPCTLSDARMAARWIIGECGLVQQPHVHLVTDAWHMNRAHLCLVDALRAGGVRIWNDTCWSIHDGPPPPEWVGLAEIKGIDDLLAGRYSADRAIHPGWGKPSLT